MNDKKEMVNPGDWVRFYSGGNLVVGVVQYFSKNVLGEIEVHTDIGTTTAIFEVRHAEPDKCKKE